MRVIALARKSFADVLHRLKKGSWWLSAVISPVKVMDTKRDPSIRCDAWGYGYLHLRLLQGTWFTLTLWYQWYWHYWQFGLVNFQSQHPAKPSFLLHLRLVSWLAPPMCLWWRWMLTATASTMARPGRLVAASPRLRRQTWRPWRPWTPWTPVTCTLLAVPWRGKRPADICRHRKTYASAIISNTYAILYSLIEHQKKSQCLRKRTLLTFLSTGHPHMNMYHIVLYHIMFYYTMSCGVLYCFVLYPGILDWIGLYHYMFLLLFDFLRYYMP